MNSLEALKELSGALSAYGIESAHRESEIILSGCIGIDKIELYRDNPALSASQVEEIQQVIKRRSNREPVQYIIGHVDFCGLKIKVGPGVLIPRPETELLVEEVLKAVTSNKLRVTSSDRAEEQKSRRSEVKTSGLPNFRTSEFPDSSLKILDLCTGSGCLALALANHFPDSDIFATDVSEKAMEYARENSKINGIKNVKFMTGNLFEPVKGMRFDIIVSNPPYIKRSDINNLQPEIRVWEPKEALDGGEDGLQFYRRIFALSAGYLKSDGHIIVELGNGEYTDAVKIAEESGLKCMSLIKDYSGIKRLLHLSLK